MNYKEALKAAIDGHKVKLTSFDKDVYVFYTKNGFYIIKTGFGGYEPILLPGNMQKGYEEVWEKGEWEIHKPEPKFAVGQFVAVGPNKYYRRIKSVNYTPEHGYTYVVIHRENGEGCDYCLESELSEVK